MIKTFHFRPQNVVVACRLEVGNLSILRFQSKDTFGLFGRSGQCGKISSCTFEDRFFNIFISKTIEHCSIVNKKLINIKVRKGSIMALNYSSDLEHGRS